ncbi:hypothetical protein ACQR1I_32180 [Bradyrhizobium sp. HKCCYLS2038]|uniref:hypothetical protein n=1 Tax=unclassified Bradyrhizobium TaxID=2631580 RepID=UPI003EC0D9B7
MIQQWLTNYGPVIPIGFVFGALFSLVKEFFRRLVFSAMLFLITYKAIVNATAHAGFQWDHQLAASGLLGVLLGCLVRPAVAGIGRRLTSPAGSSREHGENGGPTAVADVSSNDHVTED